MQFSRAISFPFRGPNVWPNLGCMALCFFIPIVGVLVATGYLVIVEKHLIENIDADAPRFSFNRFSDYLTSGVWPFLVTLILSLILVPVIMAIVLVFFVAAALLQNHQGWMIAVIVLGFLIYLAVAFLINPLLLPLILKAGLQGQFTAAFDWKFMRDFFKRVGLLTIGIQLLLALCVVPAATLSFCIPYLGMFALMAIVMFVQTHIRIQLYLTYLDRGGMPIHFEPEPIEPAFPVIQNSPYPQ